MLFRSNVLTQRSFGPESAAWVTVDGSGMKDGDYAGISAWIGCYGAIALTKDDGKYYLVMYAKPAMDETLHADRDFLDSPVMYEKIPIDTSCVTLKVHLNFQDKEDEADFVYEEAGSWKPFGIRQKLYFKLDHFTGCRFGIFVYATQESGGCADFIRFRYQAGGDHD